MDIYVKLKTIMERVSAANQHAIHKWEAGQFEGYNLIKERQRRFNSRYSTAGNDAFI